MAGGFFPLDRGGLLRLVTNFPAGITNDGIFGYILDGKKYVRTKRGPLNSDEVGIYANGTNMTSRINTVFANAKVKSVEFDAVGGGVITVTGTVQAQGKVLHFNPGTKLTGAGTINNAVLEFPYESDFFATSVKFTNCRISYPHISVKWFGSTGDGNPFALSSKYGTLGAAQAVYPFVTDLAQTLDYAAIQGAINFAIEHQSIGAKVYIPGGSYKINKGIIITKRDVDNKGAFFNLEIEGAMGAYGDPIDTVITALHLDTFVFGIQKGKGCTIRNIAAYGQNALWTYTANESLVDQSKTFVEGGVRDNRFSPYSFVVIDPFGSTAVATLSRYPGFEDYYTETSQAGSTQITIENCKAEFFVNSVTISPNDLTQNGDGITIERCFFDYNKNSVANGSSQNRSLWIRRLMCWGVTKYVFNCVDYGQGTGAFPEIDGVDIAGSVRWLIKSSAFFSMSSIKNVYAELLYGIGGNFDGALNQYNFEHCTFHFAGSYVGGTRGAGCLFQGGQADFVGCQLYYYYATPSLIYLSCPRLSLQGCVLNAPLLNSAVYDNLSTSNNYFQSTNHLVDIGTPDGITNGTVHVVRGQGYELQGVAVSDWKRRYKGPDLKSYVGLGATITVNEGAKNWTFDAGGEVNKFQVGDKIALYSGSWVDEFGLTHIFPAGIVASKAGSIITVDGLTFGMTNGSYSVYNYRIQKMSAFHVGHITSGSNTITNVLKEGYSTTITLQVGMDIDHPAFALGTYITGISGTTVTVSTNALFDDLQAPIISNKWNSECFAENSNITPYGFLAGDLIKNNFKDPANNDILQWICTKPGIVGNATYPPTFSELHSGTPGGLEEFTLFP